MNVGRKIGNNLEDIVHLIETDSTYGPIEKFFFGMHSKKEIKILDRENNQLEIYGKPVRFLCRARNPKDIHWRDHQVNLVVDTTGAFCDPSLDEDSLKGSLRGHLSAGAQLVINSAPFKFKDKSKKKPEDCITLIYGINHTSFNPHNIKIISAASCTTTALAHMVKPLLEKRETSNILTASLSTIHAATNSQNVLDSVPSTGTKDLRKNRMAFNNIILSTTGAATTLEEVIPEIKRVGFMADSIRIPIDTVSLINLNLTLHAYMDKKGEPVINREFLNKIYKDTSNGAQKGLLFYSDSQNVSSDLKGKMAAVIIEGHDTHTRTGFIDIKPAMLSKSGLKNNDGIHIPVTHSSLFGWYDNEFGSYVNCLGRLTIYIDDQLNR
jgi:glyceraldehyde 3-phosphate dehydrogenase